MAAKKTVTAKKVKTAAKPQSARAKVRAAKADLPPSERPRQSNKERAYKKNARLMYVEQAMTVGEIAKACSVRERTIFAWKMRDKEAGSDWDQLRTAHILGPGGPDSIVHEFVPRFFKLMRASIDELDKPGVNVPIGERVKMITSLTDSMTKASSAVGKLMPQLNEMTVALRLVSVLTKFVSKHFPQHASVIAEILEPFGDHIVDQFGSGG